MLRVNYSENWATKLQQDPKTVIAISPQIKLDGSGDFALPAHIASGLIDLLKLRKDQIVFVIPPKNVDFFNKIFNHRQIKILSPGDPKLRRISFSIIAPLIDRNDETPFPLKPTLALVEFNSPQIPAIHWDWTSTIYLGVSDINSQIKHKFQLPLAPNYYKSMGVLANACQEKDSPLFKGLPFDSDFEKVLALGSSAFQLLPIPLRKAILPNEQSWNNIKGNLSKTPIFYAYSFHDDLKLDFFLAVKALVAQEKLAGATIVFPGKNRKQIQKIIHEPGWVFEFHRDRVVLHRDDEEMPKPKIQIVCGFIPLNIIFALMALARPETLVTGDSSFLLALQGQKKPVYDMRPHKDNLYYSVKGIFKDYAFGFPDCQIDGSWNSSRFRDTEKHKSDKFLKIWRNYPPYDPSRLNGWNNILIAIENLPLQVPNIEIVMDYKDIPLEMPVFVSEKAMTALKLYETDLPDRPYCSEVHDQDKYLFFFNSVSSDVRVVVKIIK